MNARRIILAVLIPAAAVLAAGLFVVSRADAQTLIQPEVTNFSNSASSLSVTLANTPQTGNLLIYVGSNFGNLTSSVTGGGVPGTWSKSNSSNNWATIEIWYGVVTNASPSATVTVTMSGTQQLRMNVSEWSGMVKTMASVQDKAASKNGTTSPANTAGVSTTNAKDLLIFGVGYGLTNTVGAPTGGPWTAMTSVSTTAATPLAQSSWYQAVSSTGTYNPTVTLSVPNQRGGWDAALVAYKVAPPKTCTSIATGNWNATASWAAGCTDGPVAGDTVTINNGHTITLTAHAMSATLTINAGGFLTTGIFNLTVSGATSVSGTLTINSAGGQKTFTGNVTINAGGTWNNSGNAPVLFGGNLANSGTFTAGTGIHTLTGAGKTISNVDIPNLFVNGTYTNLNVGTLRATTILAGSGTLTNLGTLHIQGTSNSLTTLTATAAGNIVNYNGAAAQTVKPTAYYVLSLDNGGAKTMTGVTTIASDLYISTGATMTGNAAFTVGGTLYYQSTAGTTTLTAATPISIGAFNQSSGTLVDNGNTITVTGTGAAWTKTGGTFTATGTTIFTGAAPSIGASNFNHLTIAVGAGNTATLTGAVTPAGNLTVSTGTLDLSTFLANRTSSGGTLSVSNGATLKIGGTNSFPANYTTHTLGATSTVNYSGTDQAVTAETYGHLTLSGSGTKTPAAGTTTVAGDFTLAAGVTYAGATNNPVVNLAGNFSNSGTFNSGTGTFTFNGTGAQTLSGATTFTSLRMNNSGTGLTINNNVTVSTLLTLTGGNITTGASVLIVSATCATGVSRTSGHVAGNLQKAIPAGASSCTFEVGSGANYTPVVTDFVAGTTAGNITASTTGVEHPSIGGSAINSAASVNRYWTLTNGAAPLVGLPGAGFTATFNFINSSPVDFDAGADPAKFTVQRWSSPSWFATTVNATCTATPGGNLCEQVNGLAAFGDFAIGETTTYNGNAGWFNVFESTTGAGAYQGNIYTKIVGTAFNLDVVAVNALRNGVKPGYGSNPITVELLDASNSSGALTAQTDCRSTWTLITGQSFSPSPAWSSSRATVTIPIQANASRQVRVRVTQGTLVGCSTDDFSIRPTAFTVTTSAATGGTAASQTDTSGTPAIKTGANFNLTAASVAGYYGTPSIDNTKVVGTPTAGSIGGTFSAAPIGTGTASGNSFFYSEVGNFGLNADAVVDTAFTSFEASGDCIASSTSNALSGGKYGCWIGSNAVLQTTGVSGFGRFIPDNFNVANTTVPTFGTACGTFTYVGTKFTYLTAVMTVTARNGTNNGLTNAPTVNYAGAYMKLSNAASTSLNQAPYDTPGGRYTRFDALGGLTTPPLDTTGLPLTTIDPAIGVFSGGSGTLTFAPGTGLAFTRTTPSASFNADIALALNVIDTDGVVFAGNPAHFGTATLGGGISFSGNNNGMRFGRLAISNANGSQLVALRVPLETQYWNGTAFITNDKDNCTTLAGSNIMLSNPRGGFTIPPSSCTTSASDPVSFSNGRGNLIMAKPSGGAVGSVDLAVNLGTTASGNTCVAGSSVAHSPANKTYLQGAWIGGTSYTVNPSARATFGVYRGSDEVIFIRENF